MHVIVADAPKRENNVRNKDKRMNRSTKQTETYPRRPFRIAAGVLAFLFLVVGVPVCVTLGFHGTSQAFLFAFLELIMGISFANVAFRGKWGIPGLQSRKKTD